MCEYNVKCFQCDNLPESWDRYFFNGNHPITNQSLKYYDLEFEHTNSSFKTTIPCYYKYKPGYYYYPNEVKVLIR